MRAPIPDCDYRDYPDGNVTQWFGENPKLYAMHDLAGHNGIDIVAYHGCPLLAVEDGIVLEVKDTPEGYGRYVRFLSEDREWTYGHCDTISVKVGDVIKEGQQIATMGNTGFVVTQDYAKIWWGDAPNQYGTHLHLGLRIVKRSKSGWNYPGSDIRIVTQNYNNGYKGGVDPRPYLSLPILQRLVNLLTELVKLKR